MHTESEINQRKKHKEKHSITKAEIESIKKAYLTLLPIPPVSCHKEISKQLKISDHKVYTVIGIIRKQMKLPRFIEREGYEFKNPDKCLKH